MLQKKVKIRVSIASRVLSLLAMPRAKKEIPLVLISLASVKLDSVHKHAERDAGVPLVHSAPCRRAHRVGQAAAEMRSRETGTCSS